jgi:hypothetical protein
MSRSDYRRPADYQIRHHYKCRECGLETEIESYCAGPTRCNCGGLMEFSGESYPANSEDWHEERDNVNDQFRNTHRR